MIKINDMLCFVKAYDTHIKQISFQSISKSEELPSVAFRKISKTMQQRRFG